MPGILKNWARPLAGPWGPCACGGGAASAAPGLSPAHVAHGMSVHGGDHGACFIWQSMHCWRLMRILGSSICFGSAARRHGRESLGIGKCMRSTSGTHSILSQVDCFPLDCDATSNNNCSHACMHTFMHLFTRMNLPGRG